MKQGRIISRFGDIAWLPRSPDLTAVDYFLWGYLKSRVYHNKPRIIIQLKQNGNETADELARQAAATKYIGPEPALEYLIALLERQLKSGPKFNTTKPGSRHQETEKSLVKQDLVRGMGYPNQVISAQKLMSPNDSVGRTYFMWSTWYLLMLLNFHQGDVVESATIELIPKEEHSDENNLLKPKIRKCIERVRESFTRSPKKSVRKASRELAIPAMSVWRILRRCLQLRPYRLQLLQALQPTDYSLRSNFATVMLQHDDEDFLDLVFFSDESTFHLNGCVNTHNVRIWESANPHEMTQLQRDSPKLNDRACFAWPPPSPDLMPCDFYH
ncbi:hypothetical protein ANN_22567 [Periplaneta americana]|uniref:RNase H type-1 domain-containing protein n=1 Tax=Periplaneta americana TaxID=6978 RepID=A0ABQ8S8Y3_PERAM|nr:hypothetical protein ANN_22567 [Periplaneta americana]